jgi:predicted ATPase
MQLGIHNVGPVKSATVSLDDLTVLVGPNGSGKTTVSTILYAVLLAHKKARRQAGIGIVRRAALREDEPALEKLGERIIENWQDEFRDALERHLKRCFGRDLTNLARVGRSGKGAAPRIVVGNTRGKSPWQLVFRLQRDGLVLDRQHKDFIRIQSPKGPPTGRGRRLTLKQLRAYEAQLRRLLVGGFPLGAVYFPAARSGFMQMRDALQSLLYGALGAGYFDHVTVGAIPGTVADFLQFLANLDSSKHGEVDPTEIDAFEHAALKGRIILERETKGAPQSVLFSPDGLNHSWPIEFAATSAAELAPLLLYLRHASDVTDAVFIDEPEAHFHPRSQIELADHLLAVSQSLSGLVLATHSDFLASGLSNALLEAYAREKSDPPSVSLYEFCLPEKAKEGVEVQKIAFSPTDGFDIKQFSTVSDDAYDRAIRLYNLIHAEEPEE